MIKLDDKKLLISSVLISIFVLLVGVTYLLGQWQYYEEGQGILLGIYALASFALFFALRFARWGQIISAIILISLILFYASVKFDWRKEYVDNANSGRPFIMENYIDEYPTLEEHTFGFLWSEPQWVNFTDDCITPILSGARTATPECRSNQTILENYNIDITQIIEKHFMKMKRTAQRIESGDMKTKNDYQRCLTNKSCAIIPLLPANVDPTTIDQQSTDYLLTRKMFWSLVNDTKMSPEICEYIDICRVLRDTGVIPIEHPKPLPNIAP